MKEPTNKNKTQKIFFQKKRGTVCTTQPPRGCTPVPLFFLWSSNERGENYAFSNEQLKRYTIYVYVRTRAREALGVKKMKKQKPPCAACLPFFAVAYTIKHNIDSFRTELLHAVPLLIICTLCPFLCKNTKKYLHFLNFAKWSLQNDR